MHKIATIVTLALLSGCSDRELTTDLYEEGPPMILQIFAKENVNNAALDQLAFGQHPDFSTETDDGKLTNAIAGTGSQRFRIVVDELLKGHTLEEIRCFDGAWERIPEGTTAQTLDDCTLPSDLLSCSLCMRPKLDENNQPVLDENDQPVMESVGLRNVEQADRPPEHELRFIEGAVTITCDGQNMPIDVAASYWQPSGNQLVPAGGQGFNGLGPAIVLTPLEGLKTSANCQLGFASSVTDKAPDEAPVCTPDWSAVQDIATDLGHAEAIRNLACASSGDLSGATFTTEPLRAIGGFPQDGATNIATVSPIIVVHNADLDAATLAANVSIVDGANQPVNFTPTLRTDELNVIEITDAALQPNTSYTVTVNTGVTDRFGGMLSEAYVVTFTTAP